MPTRDYVSGFMTDMDRINQVAKAAEAADLPLLLAVLQLGDPTIKDLERVLEIDATGQTSKRVERAVKGKYVRRVRPSTATDRRERRVYMADKGLLLLARLMPDKMTKEVQDAIPTPPRGSVDV